MIFNVVSDGRLGYFFEILEYAGIERRTIRDRFTANAVEDTNFRTLNFFLHRMIWRLQHSGRGKGSTRRLALDAVDSQRAADRVAMH